MLTPPAPLLPAPDSAPERLPLLDALRGFALMGVFLVNLGSFTLYDYLTEAQQGALPTAGVDRWLGTLAAILVDSKAITLFSLLFGLGFAVQLERGQSPGRFVRRLLVLLGIGLLHSAGLWWGDILRFYAVFGLGLLLFRRLPTRHLLGVALLIVLVASVVLTPLMKPFLAALPAEETLYAANYAAFSGGSYAEAMRQNLRYDRYALAAFWALPFFVFGRFLLGYWAGRVGLLQDPVRHRKLLLRLCVVGLILGFGGRAFQYGRAELGLTEAFPALATGAGFMGCLLIVRVGTLALGVAYATGFALLFLRPAWRVWLEKLAPLGRMALTNYLCQTLICVPLFYGFGLGIGPAWGWPGRLAVWATLLTAQLLVSHWWLARFRFGPMEWLWRSLTYGRPQPWRLMVGTGGSTFAP